MDKKRSANIEDKKIVQAVVIADTYNDNFNPACGKNLPCLMPLANRPLLDYTLDCLSMGGVQEVIIFASARADKIKEFIKSKYWGGMVINVIVSEGCRSFGDAMRDLDAKALIRGDFILLTGNLVGSLNLIPIIERHKKIQKVDKGAAMTVIFKEGGKRTLHQSDKTYVAIDSSTGRMLYKYKEIKKNLLPDKSRLTIPIEFLLERSCLDLRCDLLETGVCICSVSVPPLFSDNFDFQTLDDFIRGLLIDEEILASTVYAHVLEPPQYAATVTNWHRYHCISLDVLNRWTYPQVLDNQPEDMYNFRFGNIYLQNHVNLAASSSLSSDVVIGSGSSVENEALISYSVIGKGCKIASKTRIKNSHIFNNVTIGNECVVENSIIGEGCIVEPKCQLKSCILGPGVTITTEKSLSKVRLQAHPIEKDDEEIFPNVYKYRSDMDSDDSDDENDAQQNVIEDWIGIHLEPEDDVESVASSAFEDDAASHQSSVPDDTNLFLSEVVDSLSRGLEDNVNWNNLVLEVNSSRYAYNVSLNEVNYNVSRAVLMVGGGSEVGTAAVWKRLSSSLTYFLPLLSNYIKDNSAMSDCLAAIEDVCEVNESLCGVCVKVLHSFYDNDILSEDAILEWHSNPREDSSFSKTIRKQAANFIKWLEEADEQSESD